MKDGHARVALALFILLVMFVDWRQDVAVNNLLELTQEQNRVLIECHEKCDSNAFVADRYAKIDRRVEVLERRLDRMPVALTAPIPPGAEPLYVDIDPRTGQRSGGAE